MRGVITELYLFSEGRKPYGFITGDDGNKYYFNQGSIVGKTLISSFYVDDEVSFRAEKTDGQNKRAAFLRLEQHVSTEHVIKYAKPGISKRLDLSKFEQILKSESREDEVILKLADIFEITRVGQHIMDQSSTYEFCLAGVTEYFKQFVRESGEALIVFSYFSNLGWQEKTLKAEREIRKRSEIVERHPLVNFYILISNATELRAKVDSRKGDHNAAIIPFSFEEILACDKKEELLECVISRFSEYYFENDMLAEDQVIDDDLLLFGDRGKVADGIVARCFAGKNSGIFGLRRSGKSSVLSAVLRRLSRNHIPYVKIEARDYESYESWKDVLFDIACEVKAYTLGTERGMDERRAAFIKRLNMRNQEDDYGRRAVKCFVDDISTCMREINKGEGEENRFVIAIDEIELIAYNSASSDVWKTKEACKGFWSAMRDSGCTLVLCGVNSSLNETSTWYYQGEELDNPMYGRITSVSASADTYLPSFTDEQTKQMINTLGSYSNLDFSDVYVQINEAFGGQPWSIRQFCSYVFKNVRNDRSPARLYRVSRATCANLLRKYNSSSEGMEMCKTILQHLNKLYPEEYALLGKMALNPEMHSTISIEETVLIDHLKKYGLIEYDEGRGDVAFRINVVRDYMCKSLTKDPKEMTNNERRRFVQDRVAICEKKLKTLVRNAYLDANGPGETAGLRMIRQFVSVDPKGNPQKIQFKCKPLNPTGIDPYNCSFSDFFDHKKCVFYFSTLKEIVLNCWQILAPKFMKVKMGKDVFTTCIKDLNAGRKDAFHFDAEDISAAPTDWEIDDTTLVAFTAAYAKMEALFRECGLM